MKAAGMPKTVFFLNQTARRNMPESCNIHSRDF